MMKKENLITFKKQLIIKNRRNNGRLKDSFKSNFVSIDNMNYKKKRKLMKTLKREIKKVENIFKELKNIKII